MQILSALDAISPAFARTKLILFSPFRKGRTWKLAATGYLTVAGTFFVPYFFFAIFFLPMARQAGGIIAVYFLAFLSIVLTLLYLVLFYVCSRLRFAFFDIALNRGAFVAPAWRKYGPQSFKWTAFKVVLGTVVTAAFAVPLAAYVRSMFVVFSQLQITPGQQLSPDVLAHIFAAYAAFFLVYLGFGLFWFASSLLGDFIVPSLALEDTTLTLAFRRLGQLLRREPGQVTLYALLKLGLALAGYMAATVGFYIVILVAGLVFGLIGLLGYLLLHALHVPIAVLIALGVLLALALYVVILYTVTLFMGTVVTFLEAYNLYFLGGRYPLLGELLTASTPVSTAYVAPPPFAPAPPSPL